MTQMPEKILDLRFGATSVSENLHRAIESEHLIEVDDGGLELAGDPAPGVNWMTVNNGPPLGCGFLMYFMFDHAYAKSAVPHGCSACYKVKVVVRTPRQLVAAWEIGKRTKCRSKWGTDLNNPYSQNIYAGYFYVSGRRNGNWRPRRDSNLRPRVARAGTRHSADFVLRAKLTCRAVRRPFWQPMRPSAAETI